MKNWLIILLVLSSFIAYKPITQAWDWTIDVVQNWGSIAPPNASEFMVTLPKVSPEEFNLTAQNYQRPTTLHSLVPQILHFDIDGKFSNQPTPNGYYRHLYGKMADGRFMAQDFFAATQSPQTSVFTLKKDGDPQDFSHAILDGRVIWFHQNGQLHSLADYANGVAQGARVFFKNKELVGATLAQKMLVFHQNGTILSIMQPQQTTAKSPDNTWQFILFRPNGSALIQIDIHGETVYNAITWTPEGKQIRQKAQIQAVRQESLPIEKRADDVLRLMYE